MPLKFQALINMSELKTIVTLQSARTLCNVRVTDLETMEQNDDRSG